MGILQIVAFGAAALAARYLLRGSRRNWFLLGTSLLAVYWLQPSIPIRYLDFWLPTATIVLAAAGWAITCPAETRWTKGNLLTGGVTAGLVLLVGLTRYMSAGGVITATRPPEISQVVLAVLAAAGVVLLLARFVPERGPAAAILIGFILVLFVVIKSAELSRLASQVLRQTSGQSAGLAAPFDIRWLGFSYVAFRLIHTLRERQMGKLSLVNLQEYLIYLIFFPAFTAGPIDRLDRFVKDLRTPIQPGASEVLEGGERFVIGLLKKFILADSLSMIALNPVNAGQVQTSGWAWVLLYAYALQIYFDFSGYTDIAIGTARWLGIGLPENFRRPYLQTSLTQFWNNWHISLTQWFRAYFFNPLTRSLRKNKALHVWAVVFITQFCTMVLIGLWHGISVNFVLWGVWHGLGLFFQNRWSEWMRPRFAESEEKIILHSILAVGGWLLTFQFVALGWIWFVLPTPQASWAYILRLFTNF